MAVFCTATGMAPSEYRSLTMLEFLEFAKLHQPEEEEL